MDTKHNFNYEKYINICNNLKKKYPFLVCQNIGKSVCGRNIYGFSLGNYKNVVLFVGGLRGKDYLTTLILLKYMDNVCNAFAKREKISGVDISFSLITKGITIIPCLNPDGLEIYSNGRNGAGEYSEFVNSISKGNYEHWCANAKGIDIAKNFNYEWEKLRQYEIDCGIFGPAPERYSGFAPESEPETECLVKFCERNNIHHAFSFLEDGEKISWNGGYRCAENSRTMAKILSVCSGYKTVHSSIEDYGTFKGWFSKNFERSSFEISINENENYLDKTYEKLEETLVIGTII